MFGCMVGMIATIFAAIFRVIGFLVLLMVTSVSSLFVGVDEATDRISESWLEQSAGMGMNIGYSPAARDSAKAAAWFMLVVGWLLTIGAVYIIVSLIVN